MVDVFVAGPSNIEERTRVALSERVQKVVVAIDRVDTAKCALEMARAVRSIVGAPVHCVPLLSRPVSPARALRTYGLGPEDVPECIVEPVVGGLAQAIEYVAPDQSSLLVLAVPNYQDERIPDAIEPTLRFAAGPVLIVRADLAGEIARRRRPLERILLPLDGKPSTATALRPIAELALASASQIDILHVAQPRKARSYEPGAMTTPPYVDQAHHEWPSWAQEFVDRFARCCSVAIPDGVRTRLFLERGDPARTILEFSDQHRSNLIVLSWNGRLGPRRAPVLSGVLHDLRRPVLVLRASALEGGGTSG